MSKCVEHNCKNVRFTKSNLPNPRLLSHNLAKNNGLAESTPILIKVAVMGKERKNVMGLHAISFMAL